VNHGQAGPVTREATAPVPPEPAAGRDLCTSSQRVGSRPRWSRRPPTCSLGLRVVETRVRALVAHRRRDDPSPEDPFRGLYLSDEHVDRLLAGGTVSSVSSVTSVTEWVDPSQLVGLSRRRRVACRGGW
jgi:hypothetical protein